MIEPSHVRLCRVAHGCCRPRPAVSVGAIVLAAVFASACASHRVQAGHPEVAVPAADRTAEGTGSAVQPTVPPGPRSTHVMVNTIEATNEPLREALGALATAPGARTHRRVAEAYRQLGVLDLAHEHFSAAVTLDPLDAASHEALARIWRDWGTPHMGLGDAYRAVHHAPARASVANTLGTLLQALGQMPDAKRWYTTALALDPGAWYALNNLCYAGIMTRQPDTVDVCQRAVAAAPESTVAKNNLALAYAAAGDLPQSQVWFRRAGDAAVAHYNYGIVLMATRDYREALQAFQAALEADPRFTLAARRARQARELGNK